MNVTVCVSPGGIVGKRFEMHEIPGIVFFPSGQTQQAFQRCLFLLRDRAGERARYLGRRSVTSFCFFTSHLQIELEYKLLHISRRYLLNLSCNRKPTSSVYNYS